MLATQGVTQGPTQVVIQGVLPKVSQQSIAAEVLCQNQSRALVQEPEQLFRDLINIEMVAMLNEAFCELHHKPYCPPSEELTRECGKVSLLTLCHTHWLQLFHAHLRLKIQSGMDRDGRRGEGRGGEGVCLMSVQIKP